MKYAYLLLLLFASMSANAMPNHFTPWPANGSLYINQSKCPGRCYSVVENGKLKDIETLSLFDVEEADPAKPIYSKAKDVRACATERLCGALIQDSCAVDTVPCPVDSVRKYCSDPLDRAFYRKLEQGFEAYCTHIVGYETYMVKELKVDETMKAMKEARLRNEELQRLARKNELNDMRRRLKELAEQADLTAGEAKEAIHTLLQYFNLRRDLRYQ